jgi:hypothetical protein
VPDHDEYSSIIGENGYRTNSSYRNAVVSLQFFCGRESFPLASKAAMLLATEASFDEMAKLDCAVGQRLFLMHVPALVNQSQFEDRVIYQFHFHYTEHLEEYVGIIDTVELEGKYSGGQSGADDKPSQDGEGNLICRETISVTPGVISNG